MCFIRGEPESGKNWTFDNLTGAATPPRIQAIADRYRYRASFWHRLKKTHFYDDTTAKRFGMVPLQRLGHITPSDLEIFVESGYTVVVQQYDIDSLKRDAFANAPFKGTCMVDNHFFPFVVEVRWWNTMVYKEIPMSLGHGMVLEEDGAAAMMHP